MTPGTTPRSTRRRATRRGIKVTAAFSRNNGGTKNLLTVCPAHPRAKTDPPLRNQAQRPGLILLPSDSRALTFLTKIIAQESGFSVVDFFLVSGCVISGLILLVGHYFPWHKLLGEPLSRLWSYRYGSGACWIGFSYWRYFGANDFITPLGLMIIYTAAGTVVWAAYWLDTLGQNKTIANRKGVNRDQGE
jgi:hypothetical protein